jgi:long-chain acyl-CoA synthetase
MSSALIAAVRIVEATLSGSRPLLNCGTELIIEKTAWVRTRFCASDRSGRRRSRAPLLFSGYWRNPAETEAVLQDSWFRTGDLMEGTAAGDIRLIDRKKDVIITRGGKTINPQPIETRLRESSLINEAIVVGDARKYLTVLIEPSTAEGAQPAANLAGRLRAEIDRVNSDLARVEQLKDFRVLPRPLEAERGERTTNGKVRRAAVVSSFAPLIDEMYGANDDVAIADHVRSRPRWRAQPSPSAAAARAVGGPGDRRRDR